MTADHARHDRLLVTRFAAGDAYSNEVAEARRLVADCPECAELANDIRLIAARAGDLPTARRRRDFRLSAADAERLRGSALQRVLRRLAAPGFAALRPVAGAAHGRWACPGRDWRIAADAVQRRRRATTPSIAPGLRRRQPPRRHVRGAGLALRRPNLPPPHPRSRSRRRRRLGPGAQAPDDMNFGGASGHQDAQATLAPPESAASPESAVSPESAASNVPSSGGDAGVGDVASAGHAVLL